MNQVSFLQYKWEDGRKFFHSPIHGRPGGNAYGYSTRGSLCKMALDMCGYNTDSDGDIFLHYVSPHFFVPIENRYNVLFTMWEAEDIPDDLHEPLCQPDLIIVPSINSKVAIEKIPGTPTVELCRHGIDTHFYYFKERKVYPETIQFLWVGSPNLRKGYDLLTKAWYDVMKEVDVNALLYMKCSKFKSIGEVKEMPRFKAVLDTRNYTREEMRQLYWDSHVFLFPSRGEGVGMPPLEAMSTGLPVVAPPWTGMADYMHEKHSYPVSFYTTEADYGCETLIAEVLLFEFKNLIRYFFYNLREGFERGRRASAYVSREFSLERMSKRLFEILEAIHVR